MTLRHGPVNGPMKHAPMDTTETLLRYHQWQFDQLWDEMQRRMMSTIVGEWLDEISGVIDVTEASNVRTD